MYHASLTESTKKHLYSCFSDTRSHLCCLVSTIAFGMVSYRKLEEKFHSVINTMQGVDVTGIKTVIVYGIPDTLSQLYQVFEYVFSSSEC